MKTLFLTFLFVVTSTISMAAIPNTNKIEFDIMRNGDLFGSHIVNFETQGDVIRVNIDIEMAYKLGPVVLFRYTHSNSEVWQDDKLIDIKTETNDDGKKHWLRGSAQSDKFHIESSDGIYDVETSIMSTSYWKLGMLQADKLLNTQYGRVHNIKVEKKGVKEKQIAGKAYKVQHYHFTDLEDGKQADFYYEVNTKQWVGLSFSLRGSDFEYIRNTPLPEEYALKSK